MLGPKQSQLGELVLKLAYCQLTQTSNHGFGNWEKENDQTPKVLPLPYFQLKPNTPTCPISASLVFAARYAQPVPCPFGEVTGGAGRSSFS